MSSGESSLLRNWMLFAIVLTLVTLGATNDPDAAGSTGGSPEYPCNANPNDTLPDSAMLQSCLNSGSLRVALLPDTWPGYLIDRPLEITRPGTELTTTTGTGHAVLRAHPDLLPNTAQLPWGRLLNGHVGGYSVKHLRLIGLASPVDFPGWDPSRPRWRPNSTFNCGLYGENAELYGDNVVIDDVESSYALCGSGMKVQGSGIQVKNSRFFMNGWPEGFMSPDPGSWADGLTVGRCSNGSIHGNFFDENTDIGLVVGGGSGCVIERNVIRNQFRYAFAGLHVGWFPDGNGNHSGTTYQMNTITSGPNLMAFGIVVGYEPWFDANLVLQGFDPFVRHTGSVVGNTVNGAVVNLAVAGIGDGLVSGNTLSNPQGTNAYGADCDPFSAQYTAHDFGAAAIDPGFDRVWFFGGDCGPWDPGVPPQSDDGTLRVDELLAPDQKLYSANGQYYLHYQLDGNLVLIGPGSSMPIWDSGTAYDPPRVGRAHMQADGNFVIYDDPDRGQGTALAETVTAGNPYGSNSGAYLVVKNDGNVVILSLSGAVLWERSDGMHRLF